MKKILKNILKNTCIMLVALFTVISNIDGYSIKANTVLIEGDFKYVVYGNHAWIESYIGTDVNVTIPETIGGKIVTDISSLTGGEAKKCVIKKITLSKNMKESRATNDALNCYETLEEIKVVSRNSELTSENGVLFSKNKKRLLVYPISKKDKEYIEPSTVEKSNGFAINKHLEKLTFSKNKKYKETPYCENMKRLKEIKMPSNITRVGPSSFFNCKKIKRVIFSKKLKQIKAGGFERCESLKSIKLPNSVEYLDYHSFAGCSSLKKVKLSSNLKVIWYSAFRWTPSLKKIMIPESVVRIRAYAFDEKTIKVKKPKYLVRKKINANSAYYIAKVKAKKGKKTKKYLAEDLTTIKAKSKKVKVFVGDQVKLKTKVYIKKKYKGILNSEILKYKSLDKKIAKVTKNGKIKGAKKGNCKIMVKLRTTGQKFVVKIKVK